MAEVALKSLRDRPYELLAELERRGRAVSAQVSHDGAIGREWVGVALRIAGELYLVAREETREVSSVPPALTRVPGAKSWVKGLANVRGHLLAVIDWRASWWMKYWAFADLRKTSSPGMRRRRSRSAIGISRARSAAAENSGRC